MNNKLKQIQSSAIKTREKLSYENPEEHRLISNLEKIIRGTTYVKRLLIISVIFFIVTGAGFMVLLYPDTAAMLTVLGMGIVGSMICWLGVVIQAKLYERTISKTQQVLASGQ